MNFGYTLTIIGAIMLAFMFYCYSKPPESTLANIAKGFGESASIAFLLAAIWLIIH